MRCLPWLILALALTGCARMEDAASGAAPARSKSGVDLPASPMSQPADGKSGHPTGTATIDGPFEVSADKSQGNVDRTIARRRARESAKPDPRGLNGKAAKDVEPQRRVQALDGEGDRDGDLADNNAEIVIGAGAGGMGLRGTGKGGGGEGFGRVAGMARMDTAGGPATLGVVRKPVAPNLDELRQQDVAPAEDARRRGRSKREASKIAQALEKKKARSEEAAKEEDKEEENALGWADNQPAPEPVQVGGQLVNEMQALSQNARVRPQLQDGQVTGLKLGNIQPQSGMYRVGLRSGDVLRSVNGQPISQANGALGALTTRQKTATLTVERDGRFRSIVVSGEAGQRSAGRDADRWQIDDDAWLARPDRTAPPVKTLPRMFYFENTYLGRTAAFQERLRRLDTALSNPQAYVHTALDPQRLDAPTDAGLSVTTALDRAHPTEPGRVFLQVALQGSQRYGWRRPPLDLAVVLDPHALAQAGPETRRMLDRLLTRLGPQDRLGVVLATNPPRVLVDVQDLRDARDALRALDGSVATGGTQIAGAMRLAGRRLAAISDGQARVPGSQTLLVLTHGNESPEPAAAVAHALTVQGAVTSVIDLSDRWGWWSVANAGHGQLYSEIDVVDAVDAELDRASKVVARLLRVNIKLAAGVRAVRVLGSRMLEEAEVKAVKAREVATDLQISKTMGVKADRGDDDDGIQTVIPFFYGGDAHVILVELWVEKPRRGMPVAEVSLRYKDMVALGNATARSHASLDALSGPTTPAERMVRRNVRGFELAEALGKASTLVARGQTDAARRLLDQAVAVSSQDQRMIDNLRNLLARSVDVSVKQAALAYAGQRRISHVAAGVTP